MSNAWEKVCLQVLLSVGVLCSGAGAASPETGSGADLIFAENFESGDLTGWGGATGDPPGTSLPPDPATIAPPYNPTVAVDLFESNEFLWQAAEPVQVGVTPGSLERERVSFLRGRVLRSDGTPLRGAHIRVFGEPQLGFTFSRPDGLFDIAVNGGGNVVLTYGKRGYFSASRTVEAPAVDYSQVGDVVLLQADAAVTEVASNATEMQVARGEVESDLSGVRQATLLFPAGTGAELRMPDGSTVPASSLHVRATEYTVGELGHLAMPAPLADNTAYTYAVELSADEATAAGADAVLFDQPIPVYVENFLQFPVGDPVPAGYFDRQRAEWIAVPNGRVIEILGESGGIASLDVDGSGQPANAEQLSELGVSEPELMRLAVLYEPGQELWRVRIEHFTPWDFNVPYAPPADADDPPDITFTDAPDPDPTAPPPPEPEPDSIPDDGAPEKPDPCLQGGSILECENQTLRESIRLTGAPFALAYSSDRVKARSSRNQITLVLSGPTIPPSLDKIHATVSFSGRRYEATFEDPTPNQKLTISWDGDDRFGREPHVEMTGAVTVEYVYPVVYYSTRDSWQAAFARVAGDGTEYTGTVQLAPRFVTRRRTMSFKAGQFAALLGGAWDVKGEKLGGWTFDVHHRYNPRTRTLLLGDGTRRFARDSGIVAPRFAGNGIEGSSGDGGPAKFALLASPAGSAFAADGSLYIADPAALRVRKVLPSGIIATAAGNGEFCDDGDCGDGGLATEARLVSAAGVALDSKGRLLIADSSCVRRVDLLGVISTVAGFCGDGTPPVLVERRGGGGGGGGGDCDDCPATEAILSGVSALAALPGGGFYLAETEANRIRHVGTDGIITTTAGTGSFGFSGDGGPARDAELAAPRGLALQPSGELLIADSGNQRIRRFGPNGILRTVAGNGVAGFDGDGGSATSAALDSPVAVAAGNDGSYWIADRLNRRVRRVSPSGLIDTVAGVGDDASAAPAGDFALQIYLDDPSGVSVTPEGELFVSDRASHHVLHVADDRPAMTIDEIRIPNGDGSQVFIFDLQGRHLRTRHGLTGATLLEFGYTPAGHLSSISDAHGNVTQIQRQANGDPTAIVGPYGQVTTLTLDANGYLQSLENPAGQSWDMASTPSGLLTSLTDPNLHATAFEHDIRGRLRLHVDAALGEKNLTRLMIEPNRFFPQYLVRYTSPENRTERMYVWHWKNGRNEWNQLTTPGGQSLTTYTQTRIDGTKRRQSPDDSVSLSGAGVDPIWGASAGTAAERSFSTPGGLFSAAHTTDLASVSSPDPFSLETRQRTTVVNGRTYTASYEAVLHEWLMESPEGRESRTEIDSLGRPAEVQAANLLPTSFSYDLRGRLASIVRGAGIDERRIEFEYDTLGRLSTITDPLLREVSFTYDGANRVLTQTLPGGRTVGFDWDPKGNLTSLTPPGRPAHGFSYTPVDLTAEYAPPEVGQGPPETTYQYNLDKKPTLITRPDGQTIALGYDSAQRLTSITSPRGTATVTYNPDTGHVASIETPEGNTLAYTMDGPLVTATTWSGEINGSVERTYDNDLRISSISVNGANPVSYTYDDDGLLIQAGALSLTRDPATGILTGTALGVVTTSYTYSPFGELSTMSASASGSPIYTSTYTRDKLGRITNKVEMIQGVTKTYAYGYDAAGRLDTVTIDGILEADYDYDLNGNRLSKTTPTGTETGTYDDQDRMLTYAGATFAYTANGETLTKTEGTDVTTFENDAFGNLLGAVLPDGTAIDYIVDAQNRRVGKNVNGVLTQGFLWQSQLAPIAELDGGGNLVSRFIYAMWVNVPDVVVRSGESLRILHDHLGSPRLVVNALTGAVMQRADYDEWGGILWDTNPGLQAFGFGGGLLDLQSSVLRFGFRNYDPKSARWLRKDPILFAGGDSNIFAALSGDPVGNSDPWGLDICIGRYPGAGGAGHVGVGVNSTDTFGHYPADDPIGSLFGEVPGVVKPDDKHDPQGTVCLKSSPAADRAVRDYIDDSIRNPPDYSFFGSNCADFVQEALRRGGFDVEMPSVPELVFLEALMANWGQRE